MSPSGAAHVSAARAGRDRTVAELVQDATEQMRTLVRDEMRLAAIELKRKGGRLGIAAGVFGGAGAFVFYALGALIAGLTLLLALVLPAWAAALVMCGALLLVAGGLALVGRSEIERAVPPVPQQAAEGVKHDIDAVKEGMRR